MVKEEKNSREKGGASLRNKKKGLNAGKVEGTKIGILCGMGVISTPMVSGAKRGMRESPMRGRFCFKEAA